MDSNENKKIPLFGYTYIVSNDFGLIKIGKSADPESRVKMIEAASGVPTKLEFKIKGDFREYIAHELLKEFRVTGEWFTCSVEHAKNALESIEIPDCNMLMFNKEQLKTYHSDVLNELLEDVGGKKNLSKLINKSIPTINSWIYHGRISKQGAKDIENNLRIKEKFSAEYLRPDLTK